MMTTTGVIYEYELLLRAPSREPIDRSFFSRDVLSLQDGIGNALLPPSSYKTLYIRLNLFFIMENSFIPDGVEIVSRAIAADNENEYEKALALYRDALARFTMGLKYEKNEARKKLILERVEGYMKRAEEYVVLEI